MKDYPKSLKDPSEIEARKQRLSQKHIKPLTDLVEEIKHEQPGKDVPWFDPLDGGIRAQCLFVLESPGRMTKNKSGSGFISRNNNDETAKNFFNFNEEAGIPRKNTVTWNIVPWDISLNGKKQTPQKSEIETGLNYLNRLINRLPNLRVIVLVGKKAQKVEEQLRVRFTDIEIAKCYHPSPLFVNRNEQNEQKIVNALKLVRRILDGLNWTGGPPFVVR